MKLKRYCLIAICAAARPGSGEGSTCLWQGGADCGINGETKQPCGPWTEADGWGGHLKPEHSSYSKFEYDLEVAEECFAYDFECHC